MFSARGASFGPRRVGGGVAMEGSLDVGLVGCEMAHSYLHIHDAGRMDESWKCKW